MGILGRTDTLGERRLAKRMAIGAIGSAILLLGVGCPSSDGGTSLSDSPVPGDIVSIVGEPLPADATLREVLQHPDAFERAARVSQILQRSGPEALEAFKHEFDTAALERGDLEYGLFGHWWARFDPQAAFLYADNHLRFDHGGVILQVVRAWARQDPIGALESKLLASREHHMPGVRDELTDVFVVGWFESGQPGLEEWMVSQQDPRAIANALRAYGRMMVLRDGPEPALEWSRTAPFEDIDRRLIIAGMLNTVAHQNPEIAVKWLKIAEEDGVDVRTFVPRIARSWAHHDPRATLDWVIEQPEGRDRDEAINRIARRWIRRDEPGLATWLEGHVGEAWTDPIRNQAVRFHVRKNHFQVDWPKLMTRAFAISEDKLAQGLAGWVLRMWFAADEAGAEAWLAANPEAVGAALVERARSIAPHEREAIEAALARQSTS